MAFIDDLLEVPGYGWKDDKGELIRPTTKQLFRHALSRMNILKDRRNWIGAISWLMALCMLPFFVVFITSYISIPLVIVFILYSMIIISTHATIWYHRYSTHKSFRFSRPIWRFITQHLVIRTFPEEIYVLSHHVHHSKSDLPGDPYNARAGLWYCMLSDVNHQSIARDLSEADYKKAVHFLRHTGVSINSYAQYQKWGSVATPQYTVLSWLLNWAFWYGTLFLFGGHALATTIFGAAMFWFILVRAFNYTGHGSGEEKHQDGTDFDRSNLSINQMRPGLFAGEWHNNHHLYPGSARAGFLKYQLDLPWVYIWCLYQLGMVSSYRDSKKEFLRKYVHKNESVQEVEEQADRQLVV
jgi:sn-1 stearoyl-lipid 9-desaturase